MSCIVLAAVGAAAIATAAPPTPAAPTVRVLVQPWYAMFTPGSPDTFRLRRANIYLNGQLTPELGYVAMINPAKVLKPAGDNEILQDAYAKATLGPLALQLGQMKVPVSTEALEPAYELLTIRRALFNESVPLFGFNRDIGLQLSARPLPGLGLTLGMFNGEMANVLDTNERKDFIARATYDAAGIRLAGSYLEGTGSGAAMPTKRRVGASVGADPGPFTLRAEALYGVDGPTAKLGWQGTAAYRLAPEWQAVARVEGWQADLAGGMERDYTLGVTWVPVPGNRAQANYVLQALPTGETAPTLLLSWQVLL